MTERYTNDHEWVRVEGDIATVGITDFAQQQLGEVVFVDLPDIDDAIEVGTEAAVVESVKAAGEVKSPVSGTVVEVNSVLEDAPETVNSSPLGDGWFYKVKLSDQGELDDLMSADEYLDFVKTLD